ncbi:unnamed protein product [Amoebophrya sp. A120]|nr:unnamed protein product [Amoebophrya sp. A120]|eukprot:GSA120T00006464001.1
MNLNKRGRGAGAGAGYSGLDFLKNRVKKAKQEETAATTEEPANTIRADEEETVTVFRTKADLQREEMEKQAQMRLVEREKKQRDAETRLENLKANFYKERQGTMFAKNRLPEGMNLSPEEEEELLKLDMTDTDEIRRINSTDYWQDIDAKELQLDDEDATPLSLTLWEIICRLRKISEPITFFGEKPMQRFRRLREKEKEKGILLELRSSRGHNAYQKQIREQEQMFVSSSPASPFGDDYSDSDKDVDHRVADLISPSKLEDAEVVQNNSQGGGRRDDEAAGGRDSDALAIPAPISSSVSSSSAAKKQRRRSSAGGLRTVASSATTSAQKLDGESKADDESENEEVDAALSDEKLLRKWIKKWTKIWESQLGEEFEKDEDARFSAQGKHQLALFRQSKKDMQPLLKRLKKQDLERDTVVLLKEMAVLCDKREYRLASEKYIELTVGNAAWPVGVTSVGIHERVGRSKISSSNIANTLNDDTTRKCMQVFKRLMKQCQTTNPPDDGSNVL